MQGKKIGKGLCCWLIWVLLLICFLEAALGDERYAGECGKKLEYSYDNMYNTVLGANISGFKKVAAAMLSQGVC